MFGICVLSDYDVSYQHDDGERIFIRENGVGLKFP